MNCINCGTPVPQVEREGGRKKQYCNERCRYEFRKANGTLGGNKPKAELVPGGTLPPLEELREEFRYDPETGFIHRIKAFGHLPADRVVSCKDGSGYISINYGKRVFRAQRLAWYLHTGEDPGSKHVDHIDRDITNNKFSNLRLASNGENKLNTGSRKDNTTGYKGVYKHSKGGYYAQICVAGKNKHLGYTKTLHEAVALRAAAMSEHYNSKFVPEDYNRQS
jgi:hypothetical protein